MEIRVESINMNYRDGCVEKILMAINVRLTTINV